MHTGSTRRPTCIRRQAPTCTGWVAAITLPNRFFGFSSDVRAHFLIWSLMAVTTEAPPTCFSKRTQFSPSSTHPLPLTCSGPVSVNGCLSPVRLLTRTGGPAPPPPTLSRMEVYSCKSFIVPSCEEDGLMAGRANKNKLSSRVHFL